LLVLWVGMWAVAFAALATFAGTARLLATNLKAALDGWSRNIAVRRADERLWAMAKSDARVMNDLQAAITRHDRRDEGLTFVPPAARVAATAPKAIPSELGLMPAYQRHYI
jgi:hypothetical protein